MHGLDPQIGKDIVRDILRGKLSSLRSEHFSLKREFQKLSSLQRQDRSQFRRVTHKDNEFSELQSKVAKRSNSITNLLHIIHQKKGLIRKYNTAADALDIKLWSK